MKRGKEEDDSSSDESESEKSASRHTTSGSLPSSSTPIEPLPPGSIIPQFYFQDGQPPSDEMREECLAKINDCFRDHPIGLKKEEFRSVTKEVCGLPSFFSSTLFGKIDSQGSGTVTRDQFVDYWIKGNMLTRDVASRIFLVVKQPNQKHISQEDLYPVLNEVVNIHPGLAFMRNLSDVKDNYVQTVLYRIFYYMNKFESSLLSQRDLKRGKLIPVMQLVDEENDINEVRRCFSYKHSQVLYNYFIELDTDGDLALSKDDIRVYNKCCLTETIVGRIFSEEPRRFHGGVKGMMCYEDFIYFMLSVEDPSTEPAIEYWFKCIDLSGSGRLTKQDFLHFYPEQRYRMETLRVPVSFDNMLTRIHDMVAPENKGYITLEDMKKCKLAGRVFDMLFNLTRFLRSEPNRDPVISTEVQDEMLILTEWDIFAEREYLRLCVEGSDEEWDKADTADSDDGGKKDEVKVEETATTSEAVKAVIDQLF